jgi:cytoskeleton protein RodZ
MREDEAQRVDGTVGESAGAGAESLGALLKRTRAARGLSVEQLAAELRIEPGRLSALEAGDFGAFGAAVFVKGYLKQYSQRLGLDYAELLARYERAVGVEQMPIVHRTGTRWREERRGSRWLIIVLGALIAASAYLLWTNGVVEDLVRAQRQDPDTDRAVPATEPERPVAAQPQTAAAPREIVPIPAAPASESERSDPRVVDDSGIVPLDDAASALASEAPAVETQPAPAAASARPPGHAGIAIATRDDSWVEIIDGAGERLYYGLARAGETLSLDGRPPLSFVLGNAAAVELTVSGQRYAFPEGSVAGNVARFTVTEVGLTRE